jgi:hypothetical protein
MVRQTRDSSLDALLGLDGQTYFVDEEGAFWVKFDVKECPASAERPHGIKYSLTLHNAKGERLVGFDNAHAISGTAGPSRRMRQEHDHKHRLKTVRPYDYQDAATLLDDFWRMVDAVLRELGVLK